MVQAAAGTPTIPEEFKVRWKAADGTSVLVHGDAFEFLDSIAGNSVDCIWTDPPYFLSNDGITCIAGKMVKVNKGAWDRSRGIELDHQFNRRWIEKCHRVLKPNGTIWITGTVHIYLSVGMALLQQGFRILNDITWEKPNPPPNLGRRCFTHSTELLLWATKSKKGSEHRYRFNYDQMCSDNLGRQMKTVWRIPPPAKDEKTFGKHPTQKPVALISRCLRASTDPGHLVVDPFGGSGSTMIAALSLNRKSLCCERDERFVDLAVRRISSAVKQLDQLHLMQ